MDLAKFLGEGRFAVDTGGEGGIIGVGGAVGVVGSMWSVVKEMECISL